MQSWIPVQAAVMANLSTDFIWTASLIKHQQMRLDYTGLPIVATIEGKWFPFRQANSGTTVSMRQDRFGGWQPPEITNTADLINSFLQEGPASVCEPTLNKGQGDTTPVPQPPPKPQPIDPPGGRCDPPLSSTPPNRVKTE